jgi:hypothetical protein
MTKLSHSAVDRYLKCPLSYKLHYIDKIRPTTVSANLVFGNALDKAINCLLLKQPDAHKVFITNWLNTEINNTLVYIPKSELIQYNKSDIDLEILNEQDWLDIKLYNSTLENSSDLESIVNEVLNLKKQDLNSNQQAIFNFLSWSSLKRKGELIIDAYAEKVIPRIVEVKSIQKEITFENDKGDKITGFIDLIATLDDGITYVLDNKSSRVKYKPQSVQESPQLTLYATHEDISKAGFIVYVKTIIKHREKTCVKCSHVTDNNRIKSCPNIKNKVRCGGDFTEVMTPKVDIQILLDDVNKELVDSILMKYDEINGLINAQAFEPNTESCNNWYGSKCSYYNLCHNNDDTGLIKS